MAIKKSVRLVDKTVKLCNELTPPNEARNGVNFSGALNAMAEQYLIFAKECLPSLTSEQIEAFYCVYNGYQPPSTLEQEIGMLAWNISEGYQNDAQVRDLLGDEADSVAFIDTIKGWSKPQKLAVIYMARAYWRQGQISGE